MTPSPLLMGRSLRRTAWSYPLLVTLVLAVAAVLAGAASWSSRPEAWTLGPTMPLRAAVAWVGLSAPALAPAAALFGSFLAARRLLRSGASDACDLAGVGPSDRWRAIAPVWLMLAAIGVLWTGFLEPAAWRTTLEIREAAARPLGAHILPNGGIVLHDREALRIHHPEGRATVLGFSPELPSSGPAQVVTEMGTWTARRVRRRLLDNVIPRPLPPLARSLWTLAEDDSPRACTLFHRRLALGPLLLLLSYVGTMAGSLGTARRLPTVAPSAVGLLLVTLATGRWADLAGSGSPTLLGWLPILPAALAAFVLNRLR